jgi:phosphoribulokinase
MLEWWWLSICYRGSQKPVFCSHNSIRQQVMDFLESVFCGQVPGRDHEWPTLMRDSQELLAEAVHQGHISNS